MGLMVNEARTLLHAKTGFTAGEYIIYLVFCLDFGLLLYAMTTAFIFHCL